MRVFSIAVMLTALAASPAQSQQIVITNLDHFVPATPIFQNFSAAQWFAVGFTTDGASYDLDLVETLVRATTVTAGIVAELRSGTPLGGPGAVIGTFSLELGEKNIHLPDGPVMLAPNTTYFFSLGYPLGNATIGDWFTTETDLTADGPAMLEQAWVSSSQGASWATGGSILTNSRFLFEVVAVPEPASGLLGAAALLGVALCLAFREQGRDRWRLGGRTTSRAGRIEVLAAPGEAAVRVDPVIGHARL